MCEIENYIKKPISQAFDCIVTSKDGIFICGLLATLNEKREIKQGKSQIVENSGPKTGPNRGGGKN